MIIKNSDLLASHGNRYGRAMALDILEAGLVAVDPYQKTRELVRMEGDRLLVGDRPRMDVSGFGDEVIDLSEVGNVYVLGAGKSVLRMAQALEDILGDRLTGGAIVVKKGEGTNLRRISVTEGAHPIPDEASMAGARKIVEIARSTKPGDLVFTVFSSGASSLFPLPMDGFTLEDLQVIYKLAIKYGHQSIIHRVMTHCSAVSNGRILGLLRPARTINLVMALAQYERWHGELHTGGCWISSWPPGPRRMREAVDDMMAEPWWGELPPSVRCALESRDSQYEVPDIDEFRTGNFSFWQPVDSHEMLESASHRADALGMRGVILGCWYWAQMSEIAQVVGAISRECLQYGAPFRPPVALISGGELTVQVRDADGIGGRNQEYALTLLLGLDSNLADRVVIASMDSDGTDGPGTQLSLCGPEDFQSAAGGLVDGSAIERARILGLDLHQELKNHNSSIPLRTLGSDIITGNTGMCSGDLSVVLLV